MIVCPNCNHQNPGGAVQCEACYTPLPSMLDCPSCGAPVQSDASFCGQCGADLSGTSSTDPNRVSTPGSSDSLAMVARSNHSDSEESLASTPESSALPPIPDLNLPDVPIPNLSTPFGSTDPDPLETPSSTLPPSSESASAAVESRNEPIKSASTEPSPSPLFQSTQLQTPIIQLIHTHTNIALDVPQHLNIIHIGKPNDRVPPDIDVSGFQDSEVVSRVHADIRIEGETYYLEDMGSSNGTYVNNVPLLRGNRHRLRSGDRIALGKGDKVSFIVQITSP